MADEKTRFTDAELKEFKEIILGKLEDAKNDYDLLKSSMSGSDDHGTNDTSPTFKLMEDGSDVLSREETAQLAVRQQKFIKHLEDALIRIDTHLCGMVKQAGWREVITVPMVDQASCPPKALC